MCDFKNKTVLLCVVWFINVSPKMITYYKSLLLLCTCMVSEEGFVKRAQCFVSNENIKENIPLWQMGADWLAAVDVHVTGGYPVQQSGAVLGLPDVQPWEEQHHGYRTGNPGDAELIEEPSSHHNQSVGFPLPYNRRVSSAHHRTGSTVCLLTVLFFVWIMKYIWLHYRFYLYLTCLRFSHTLHLFTLPTSITCA